MAGARYVYEPGSGQPVVALEGIDLEFRPGELVCIFGHNGSGKSTLAKLLNGLEVPIEGEVFVDGISTLDESRIWDVRQRVGMVFQNPDNQLVATVVEDDVAFGAENIGVEPREIQVRVDRAMELLGVGDLRSKAPHLLSGGQKQRVAIAGVLVMNPRYIVFDEPTSLLDPQGRASVLEAAESLVAEHGIGVILITHFMHEAARADRVVVLDQGRVVMQGTPREVFSRVDELHRIGLDVPAITQVADHLRAGGRTDLRADILTLDELMDEMFGAA